MAVARFRELAARMDALLVDRLGDRALLDGGRELSGEFISPYSGDKAKGTHRINLGNVATPDEVTEPTFEMRVADLLTLKKGDVVDVQLSLEQGGGRHTVTQIKPDGTGMAVLVLRRE